jgi:NAD(P)-dependent dehydrogenase (short-subunit alcohol dehydrogenase family)
MLLDGLVATVTGAAQGIGLAIATRYAEEGARVVIGDRNVEGGELAAAALRDAGFQAQFAAVDVTDEASVERYLARALELYGTVDVAVANAGVLMYVPLLEMSHQDWDRTLAVNLTGVYHTCKVFGTYLVQRGTGGRIVCAASNGGKRGEAGAAAYCATKFGVIGLVQALALELAPHDITVNAVCPGEVDTDMYAYIIRQRARETGTTPEEFRRQVEDSIPLGKRLTKPSEVADAYVFLASPLAANVTGSTVDVTGGMF